MVILAPEYRQVIFAACPSCHGLWFQARLAGSSLDSISRLEAPYGGKPAGMRIRGRTERRCVSCARALSAATIERIEVDRCATCDALWLDAGELPAVAAWYRERRGMESRARQPGAQRAEEPSRKAKSPRTTKAVNQAGSYSPTEIVGEVASQLAFHGAMEGVAWLAEGVVNFVGICIAGIADGL